MTEEIIIDGVNVKECRRRIGKNNYCRYYKRPCADNNFNCIWKQNLRLKQENEQAKTTVEECHKYIAKLEDENEKLKEENKELKGLLQDDELCYVENCNKCKLAYVTDENYRKALEEIREIAEKYKDMEGCRIPLGAIKMTVDEVLE